VKRWLSRAISVRANVVATTIFQTEAILHHQTIVSPIVFVGGRFYQVTGPPLSFARQLFQSISGSTIRFDRIPRHL